MKDFTLDYKKIKESAGKIIRINKDSANCFRLGEIMRSIGFLKSKSKFEYSYCGNDICITNGYVMFKNKCLIKIK